jgi:hypothetical protein
MSGWRKSHDRGSAVIEFALVLPILVMLVFGIFQFGLFFNRQQGFHAAAREGARVGAIPTTTADDIEGRVDNALSGITGATGRELTISDIDPTEALAVLYTGADRPCFERQGQSVVVQLKVPTTIEIPLWGSKDLTITGRGEFRCE